jgi:hypothetical protein
MLLTLLHEKGTFLFKNFLALQICAPCNFTILIAILQGKNSFSTLTEFFPFFVPLFLGDSVSATSCFTEGHTPPYLLLKLTDVLTDVITYVLTDV